MVWIELTKSEKINAKNKYSALFAGDTAKYG